MEFVDNTVLLKSSGQRNYYKSDYIFSTFVILLPFLYQYKSIGEMISFGEFILFLFILYYAIVDFRFKVKININIMEYVFYFLAINSTLFCFFFSYFNVFDALTVFFRLCFYAILIVLSKKHFSFVKSYRVYKGAVYLFASYLLLQKIYYVYYGGYLPIYISYDLIFSPEKRVMDLAELYRWDFRPSSLFLEPSYYVFFCFPFLCIEMFAVKKRTFWNYVSLSIVIVSFILSKSSSGIIVIFMISTFKIGTFLKKNHFSKQFSSLIVGIVAIVIVTLLFLVESDNDILQRIQNGASLSYRVTRGMIIYDSLSLFHKIFGVGLNNVEAYMNANGMSTVYDEGNLGYMSSLLAVFNSFGLIGGVFFIAYLYSIWESIKHSDLSKVLFVILLFSIGYEAVLFTYRFFFLYVIVTSNELLDSNVNTIT